MNSYSFVISREALKEMSSKDLIAMSAESDKFLADFDKLLYQQCACSAYKADGLRMMKTRIESELKVRASIVPTATSSVDEVIK